MSREALGIWRGSYEASVTGGRENRRAMLMVTREYSGLRQLSEMDDGADPAAPNSREVGLTCGWLHITPEKGTRARSK